VFLSWFRLPLLTGPEQPRSPGPSQRLFTHSTAPVSHLPSLALPRNSDRADQFQGELGMSTMSDRSFCLSCVHSSQGTNDVQQGSQTYIVDLLERIARNTDPTHGTGSRGDRKVHGRRGRSPVRRTAENNALAVGS